MRNHGFTLIELLIVVAIIGILAAIAIPNFLQAQVRAKIAKVESDFASLATALETYHLDNNVYPLNAYTQGAATPVWQWGQTSRTCLWRLSTPVQYLSSPASLTSPFGTTVGDHFPDGAWRWHPDVYWYVASTDSAGVFHWVVNNPLHDSRRQVQWLLVDAGPDRSIWNPWGGIPYDPTNGTISNGDIHRFGP